MRVLVTGGAGYIGSHVCKALAYHGMEPVVMDNLTTGHRWAVKWGPLIEDDLSDPLKIRRILRAYHIEAVIHLAASAYVGESMVVPRLYFENNTRNTVNLLGAMLDEEVRCIVFSSTCATYGIPSDVPIDESTAQRPVNPYGDSKYFIERVLKWYNHAYGLSHIALRYFNAAGADPDGEIGECHIPETHLIPVALEVASGQRTSLEVYGTDYPTPDGTAVRDYVHVSDLAQAHILALEHLASGKASTSLNLGTGKGYSVREVVRMIEVIAGHTVNVVERPRRPGDPPRLVASPARAEHELGWNPERSSLEMIIETAWNWYTRGNPYGPR